MQIKNFDFNESGRDQLRRMDKGEDWPVVYLLANDHDIYVGETTSAYNRIGQHLLSPQKKHLNSFKVIFDDTYNKSVILDYEQRLIKYLKADGKYRNILNRNAGQSSRHNYYQRDQYDSKFKNLWEELFYCDIVQNNIATIENKNVFKFSPYTSLTEEQNNVGNAVLKDIYEKISSNRFGVSIVNGCAGTGKTVLAISLINSLVNAKKITSERLDEEDNSEKIGILSQIKEYVDTTKPLKIGFVFPMSGIRDTIAGVFKDFGNGLSNKLVISPNKLKNEEYDILFVDESHRLSKRKNIVNYNDYDKTCAKLGMDKFVANQLDWVLSRSKYCVLFYDKDQSIKGSDISYNEYQSTLHKYTSNINVLNLSTQMRCLGGEAYTDYVKDILNCKADKFKDIVNYDFKIFDDVQEMIDEIKRLDNDEKIRLCRTVAGYSWEWVTKPESTPKNTMDHYNLLKKSGCYDIDIQGHKFIWNLTTEDWISRLDSHDTIGCIHTTQGFDLNYVGVIFGREIDYNPALNRIEIDIDKFKDRNVKAGCDDATIKEYIINTYTTMLARGIKGCYVFAYNKKLRDYLHRFIKK